MVELLRTNNPVLISWSSALLRDAAILPILLDAHMSVLEGSIGALPRRLMVADDDAPRARRILDEAGIALPDD
ncbi:MAG: DUF2007 domain-containing protein [Alphaproteobacteria bacterium]